MKAMQLARAHEKLRAVELPSRALLPGEVRIAVSACAVCRTDLHVVDGELPDPKLPVIPGHEIVGRIVELGAGVDNFKQGQRVGVPWLGWTSAYANSADAAKKISARMRASRVTPSMAASRPRQSRMRVSFSRCRHATPTKTRHRCCVRD